MAFKFPFTNYHELNLTWVLDQLKALFEKSEENVTVIENYDGRLTAVETELPLVADTAQDAAQTAAAAASLAQTAKATSDTAQENAIQAQSAAGVARQEAQGAQTAADAATQAAQQAQAATMNFDGRITQAENNALSALNKIGNLGDLRTSAKNNLVVAINEVAQSGGGGSGGAVNDVQIDGRSIVSNGIASIPLASSARYGVTRPLSNGGVTIDAQGRISTARASLASIKTATANYPVIVPSNQYAAVFYGLATAAGDSTQASSSNEVGTYTDEAKAAISLMLGLNGKQDAPSTAGTAGQVLSLDRQLNPVWATPSGGGGGSEKTWKKFRDVTVTLDKPTTDVTYVEGEDGITQFSFSVDDDGNSFEFTDIKILAIVKNITGTGMFTIFSGTRQRNISIMNFRGTATQGQARVYECESVLIDGVRFYSGTYGTQYATTINQLAPIQIVNNTAFGGNYNNFLNEFVKSTALFNAVNMITMYFGGSTAEGRVVFFGK